MGVATTYEFATIASFNDGGIYDALAVAGSSSAFVYGGFGAEFGTSVGGFDQFGVTGTISLEGTNASFAMLNNGNFVSVTQDVDSIIYRIYSVYFTPQSALIDIGDTGSSLADVAALKNGGFAIASQDLVLGDSDIDLRLYNSGGVFQTAITVAISADNDTEVTVAGDQTSGNVAVAWTRSAGGQSEIWYAVYSQTGTQVVGATLLDTTSTFNDSPQLVATNGGFAIAYRDSDGGADKGVIEVRAISSAGILGSSTVLSDGGSDFFQPAIARLSTGQIVVSAATTATGYIFNFLLDPATLGTLGQEIHVPTITDFMFSPELAAWDNGKFVHLSQNQSQGVGAISTMTARRVLTSDGEGDKIIAVNDMAHHLLGAGGNDKLYGTSNFEDLLESGEGNDILDGKGGEDEMRGGAGNDSYFVDTEGDLIVEGVNGGTDKVTSTADFYTLSANVENLTLGNGANGGFGNDGNNTLTGNSGMNVLRGFGGKDKLDGKAGADYMEGGDGDDTYYVDDAGDQVHEEAGTAAGKKDVVNVSFNGAIWSLGDNVENGNLTGSGAQELYGNDGANTLTSKGNANSFTVAHSLIGYGGKDTLKGGSGYDALYGGTGADKLTGGGGLDEFRFDALETSANKDTVTDFSQSDNDLLVFHASAFTGLAAHIGTNLGNTLAGGDAFFLGTSADDAEDRLIYHAATGNLWYDADGTGVTAQVLVAVLSNTPALNAFDIFIA